MKTKNYKKKYMTRMEPNKNKQKKVRKVEERDKI